MKLAWVLVLSSFFSVLTRAEKSPEYPSSAIAIPSEFTGDVRVKRAGQSTWFGVKQDTVLFEGDLLFVGKGSLRLKYLREQASIGLPVNSIFEVERNLPSATRQKRSFANAQGNGGVLKPKMQDSAGNFTRTMAAPGEEAEAQKNSLSGMVIDRFTRKLNLVEPPGDSVVVAQQFPATMHVIAELVEGIRLNGYLWEVGVQEPVWLGVGTHFFADVRIPKPGKYIFQAISDNERYASVPIRIEAKSINAAVLIPPTWNGQGTMVVK